ncbi:hypothetical protein SESBI_18026 [Sesbania bispinosa]|nr:hypothetical protein SESBI_18026 [Sesbania bispinosa]
MATLADEPICIDLPMGQLILLAIEIGLWSNIMANWPIGPLAFTLANYETLAKRPIWLHLPMDQLILLAIEIGSLAFILAHWRITKHWPMGQYA